MLAASPVHRYKRRAVSERVCLYVRSLVLCSWDEVIMGVMTPGKPVHTELVRQTKRVRTSCPELEGVGPMATLIVLFLSTFICCHGH